MKTPSEKFLEAVVEAAKEVTYSEGVTAESTLGSLDAGDLEVSNIADILEFNLEINLPDYTENTITNRDEMTLRGFAELLRLDLQRHGVELGKVMEGKL